MQEKKPLRGGLWLLFFWGSIALILFEIITSVVNGCLYEDGILPALFGLVYLACYFLLPGLLKKPQALTPPEENPALAQSAKLTLIRDNNPVAAALPTRIYQGGQLLCTLKSGESVTVNLHQRFTLLSTDTSGSQNCRILVEAPEGGNGSLHLSGGVFRPKTLTW